ncbi:MAG: hypothetical protein OXR66_07315 [Candidatus Woesearchaeota archaeon]|nr:hypothetical protein [Candidatus Woesearchaeota archaeon]
MPRRQTLRNKAILTATIFFFVVLIADVISTFSLRELVPYLEANLVYPYIGVAGVLLINVAFVGGLYYLYVRAPHPDARFVILFALVTFCIVRVVVVWGNIQVVLDPPTLEAAQQITQSMRVAAVVYYAKMNLLPYIIGIVTYWLFRLDHDVTLRK